MGTMNEGSWKKPNLIVKTWERCKYSMGSPRRERAAREDTGGRRRRVRTPEGCFSVYVGPHRQRFVVPTEYANHPLFRVFLDEAESQFGGFASDGPLVLPCDVVSFRGFLAAVEDDEDDDDGEMIQRLGCRRGFSWSGYGLLSPSSNDGATNHFRRKFSFRII